MTLAHVAAREGHMTCLQTLVDHNIDVTIEDKDGRSPADYAYAAGQSGCGRYLVMEESCWLLSVRIAKLHRELKDCKDENKELRQKLQVSRSFFTFAFMPLRLLYLLHFHLLHLLSHGTLKTATRMLLLWLPFSCFPDSAFCSVIVFNCFATRSLKVGRHLVCQTDRKLLAGTR